MLSYNLGKKHDPKSAISKANMHAHMYVGARISYDSTMYMYQFEMLLITLFTTINQTSNMQLAEDLSQLIAYKLQNDHTHHKFLMRFLTSD